MAQWLTFVILSIVSLVLPASATAQGTFFDRPYIFCCGYTFSQWIGRPLSYDGQAIDRIVQMGGTATGVSGGWIEIEEVQGVRDWSKIDHRVHQAHIRGLAMFGYVGTTPYWALPAHLRSDPTAYYRNPPAEEHAEAFMSYCRELAARYAGRVDYWTFWNEPNGCSWVNAGCNNMDGYGLYTHWLKRAYTALKQGNPNCRVAAGNLDYHEGVPGYTYIQGMYDSGAKNYFDAINIHPYGYGPNDLYWQGVHETRAVMVANGDGHKTIWIGEYGWHNTLAPDAPAKLQSVLSKLVSPQYHYVEMANYLIVNDLPTGESPSYGLCDQDLNPRPIWFAYRDFPKNLPPRTTPTPTVTGTPPTPTNTPTATVTPPPTPTLAPGALRNSGFEGESGFVIPPGSASRPGNHAWLFQNHPLIEVPTWWYPFWRTGPVPHAPGVFYSRPDFLVTVRQVPWLSPLRIDSGQRSVQMLISYGVTDSGYYQRVAATPGKRYRFTARAHAFTACGDGMAVSGSDCPHFDPYQVGLSCGIDPTGGTDFLASTVVWGAGVSHYDIFADLPAVEAEATGETITVFLRAAFKWGLKHNQAFFDTARLYELSDAPGGPNPAAITAY